MVNDCNDADLQASDVSDNPHGTATQGAQGNINIKDSLASLS